MSEAGRTENHRRSLLDWLSDLFNDEPADRTELMEFLRDAADRQLMDREALNIILAHCRSRRCKRGTS